MNIIQPKRYQWIVPLLIILSGVSGLMNNNLEKVIQVIWYILIFFSIVLLVIGIINHKKYLQQQTEASKEKQKNAL